MRKNDRQNRVSVGVADYADTAQAGSAAVSMALAAGPDRPPDCCLLFSTSRHDPELLLKSVVERLPGTPPVYGGYAVGIIGEDTLGYDGFQVGLALIWLQNGRVSVAIERELNTGEEDVGNRLTQTLKGQKYLGTPSLLLLYDAVNRTAGQFSLNMATPILAGGLDQISEEVAFAGAGLVGDMQCRTTHQWTGDQVDTQTAMVLAFSGSIEMKQVILHGCRPSSSYHQVTKTEDNVVLEIDHRPALDVVAELLGPESGKSWRDYAFFVTLGVNKGDRYGPFNPDLYANRLCMSVDLERRALIMFEPDLRAGDSVQLMLRDIHFNYITNNIEQFLEANGPNKPIFALYIDCAGRASAYSHMDQEEAAVVQAALKDVCPLLGLYSGVEVARVAGRPQALDWTGVLCVFYERETPTELVDLPFRLPPISQTTEAPEEVAGSRPDNLIAELEYYRQALDRAAGEQLRFDAQMSVTSRRLRQTEEGFRILDSLKRTVTVKQTKEKLFQQSLQMILSQMTIDRAVILASDGLEYRPMYAAGFNDVDVEDLSRESLIFPESLHENGWLIANKKDKSDLLSGLRSTLKLPFFLAVPIARPRGNIVLAVGRMREIAPFYPPFDAGDIANFNAIGSYLSSVADNLELYNDLETLASSFKRFVPEAFLRILGRSDLTQIQLGDQVARKMSILVSDVRNFTTLSERMNAEQVFSFVNEFLAEIGPIVRNHSGFVNKYLGDAIMALFEEPGRAFDAAIDLIQQVNEFNDRRRLQRLFPIQIGVGINYGDMMLGTIGEGERLENSVLSDAVNLGFRLETMSKVYGVNILTTDTTLDVLGKSKDLLIRPLDIVAAKGKRDQIRIVEILNGMNDTKLEKKLSTLEQYAVALQSYEFGGYDDAAILFQRISKLDPDDRAARVMMLKCRKLAEGDAYVEE